MRRADAPKSRAADLKSKGAEPCLPDITCQYLLDILLEVGPTGSTGFGRARITQAEIAHWQANSAIYLDPWECRTLLRLSEAWCAQAALSEDPQCPPPYAEVNTARVRAKVEAQIDSVLG